MPSSRVQIVQHLCISSRPLRDTNINRRVALIRRDDLATCELRLRVRREDDEVPGVVGNGQGGERVSNLIIVPRLDGKDAALDERSVSVGGRAALDGEGTVCGGGGVLGVDAERPVALSIGVVASALKRLDDPFRLVGPHGLGVGGARCWAREDEGGREEGEEGLGEIHCDCLSLWGA